MSGFRDHRIYLAPLLRALVGKGPTAPAGIYEQVADSAGVTPQEREARGEREGGGDPIYRNRIQFARQSLVDAGLIVGSYDPRWKRGLWEITRDGEALARRIASDERLAEELWRLAAEGAKRRVQERQQSRELAGLTSADSPADESPTPPESSDSIANTGERIAELVEEANELTMQAMLAHVRSMDDTAFEHLVARVLKAVLGANDVRVTPPSHDGGIDGFLYFDDLRLRFAVFQAKRYSDGSTVDRPYIDAFATAARRHKAAHSLFITSSKFSKGAQDAAREEGIRAIDGTAFVELMARHEIGLRAKEKYVVYELDPAWSLSDTDG